MNYDKGAIRRKMNRKEQFFMTAFLSAAVMLVFVYGIELSSIVNNYLEYKGIHKHIDITRLLLKLFKREDMAEVIIDEPTHNNDGTDKNHSER